MMCVFLIIEALLKSLEICDPYLRLLLGLGWSRCANKAFHILPFLAFYIVCFANAGAELEVILHLFTAHVLSVSCSKVIWLVTFAAVLCFDLDVGLAIAMGFTFLIITIRSHRYL